MLQKFSNILLSVRVLPVLDYVPPPPENPKFNPRPRTHECDRTAGVRPVTSYPSQQSAEGYVGNAPASFNMGGCP